MKKVLCKFDYRKSCLTALLTVLLIASLAFLTAASASADNISDWDSDKAAIYCTLNENGSVTVNGLKAGHAVFTIVSGNYEPVTVNGTTYTVAKEAFIGNEIIVQAASNAELEAGNLSNELENYRLHIKFTASLASESNISTTKSEAGQSTGTISLDEVMSGYPVSLVAYSNGSAVGTSNGRTINGLSAGNYSVRVLGASSGTTGYLNSELIDVTVGEKPIDISTQIYLDSQLQENASCGTLTITDGTNSGTSFIAGTSLTASIQANSGYKVQKILVTDGYNTEKYSSAVDSSTTDKTSLNCQFPMSTETVKVIGIFTAAESHNISVASNTDGCTVTVKCGDSDVTQCTYGNTLAIALTPAANYQADYITVAYGGKTYRIPESGSLTDNATQYTMPDADVTITGYFKAKQSLTGTEGHTITAGVSSETPYGTVKVYSNGTEISQAAKDTSLVIKAQANDGYLVDYIVLGDGTIKPGYGSSANAATYSFDYTMPDKDLAVTGYFKSKPSYTVTPSVAESGTGAVSVTSEGTPITQCVSGKTLTVTLTPAEGYESDYVEFITSTYKKIVPSSGTLTTNTCTCTMPEENLAIVAHFTPNGTAAKLEVKFNDKDKKTTVATGIQDYQFTVTVDGEKVKLENVKYSYSYDPIDNVTIYPDYDDYRLWIQPLCEGEVEVEIVARAETSEGKTMVASDTMTLTIKDSGLPYNPSFTKAWIRYRNDDGTWYRDAQRDMYIEATAPAAMLTAVYVDGYYVPAYSSGRTNWELYDVRDAGQYYTGIYLKNAYMATLSNGTHRLRLDYSNGVSANTTLYITTIYGRPRTGDNADMTFFVLAPLSLAGILLTAGALSSNRKRKGSGT